MRGVAIGSLALWAALAARVALPQNSAPDAREVAAVDPEAEEYVAPSTEGDGLDVEAEAAPRVPNFAADVPPPRDPIAEAEWAGIVEGYAYEREPPPAPPEFDEGLALGEGFLQAVRVSAWIAVVALTLAVLVYFVRRGRRNTEVSNAGRSYGVTDELLAASGAELESALDRNLRAGDFRAALRYRFGQVLQALRAAGRLRWVPGKTNEEYRAELPAGRLRESFGGLAAQFAYATYGGRAVGRAQFESFAAAADALLTELPPSPGGSAASRRGVGGGVATSVAAVLTAVGLTACGEWVETYDPDDDGAYGTELLPGVLAAGLPRGEFVELESNWAADGLLGGWRAEAVYVAIGGGLSYTDTEAKHLLAFAAAGGEVLLATKEVSNAVLEPFVEDACLATGSVTPDTRLVPGERLRSARGEEFEVPLLTQRIGDVLHANYVARRDSCLGRARDLLAMRRPQTREYDTLTGEARFEFAPWSASPAVEPVLVRMPYGAGGVMVLSFPLLLTNVYAVDSAGRELIEAVLGYLPAGAEVVYFDAPRRSPEWVVAEENRPDPGFALGSPSNADDNILKHVLARPPLAAAWYALLGGALVFLALGVKRRQRVVPVVHPRRNTTREYLGNVSRLYLASPDNARMARKQLALFENWTRARFGLLPLRDARDGERFRALRGVDAELVDAVDRYHSSVERGQGLSNGGLVRLVRILRAVRRSIG